MSSVDRNLTVNSGWFAGPAFGAAMTGAAAYFEMSRQLAAVLFWGGVCVFLCSILAALAAAEQAKGKRKYVIGPFLLMGIGTSLLCGGAAWFFWPHSKQTNNDQKVIISKTDLPNSTAYFDCSMGWWPEAESAAKDVFNISVMKFDMADPIIGMGSGPIVKENHNKQFSSVAPLKCEITFHGESPIFNIEVPFSVDLYETINDNNRNRNGEHIRTLNAPFVVKQIIIPNKNVVTFYVYSFDVNAYIGVRQPDKYTFVTGDLLNRYEGKFIRPNSQSMLVGPNPRPN